MYIDQNWESLLEVRRQELEREIRQVQRLALVPHQPAAWQRWTGRSIAWVGRMLMWWGERVARAENRPQTSLAR